MNNGKQELFKKIPGVDRLLMSILKLERIDAVLAFDAGRA